MKYVLFYLFNWLSTLILQYVNAYLHCMHIYKCSISIFHYIPVALNIKLYRHGACNTTMTRNGQMTSQYSVTKRPTKIVCVCVTKPDLMLQTPEEFHTFTTSCTERLPIMHLILRASCNQPIQKVLDFLNNIPDIFKVSSNVSSDGRKAGRYYKQQAQTILCEAVKSDNNLRTVLALINADTVVDDPESVISPLLFAAEQGSSEVIKVLIKHGAPVDHCNFRKETSLFIACQHAQWDAAKLLFESSANVFTTNIDDKSAFTIAKEKHGVALL